MDPILTIVLYGDVRSAGCLILIHVLLWWILSSNIFQEELCYYSPWLFVCLRMFASFFHSHSIIWLHRKLLGHPFFPWNLVDVIPLLSSAEGCIKREGSYDLCSLRKTNWTIAIEFQSFHSTFTDVANFAYFSWHMVCSFNLELPNFLHFKKLFWIFLSFFLFPFVPLFRIRICAYELPLLQFVLSCV